MARTAKKKIPIFDDGVLLTDDADSLDFTGSGVSGSVSGRDVTESIPGGVSSPETPAGTIDGVNTVFTFTKSPKVIVIDQGRTLIINKGFSLSGLVATLDLAPINEIYSI